MDSISETPKNTEKHPEHLPFTKIEELYPFQGSIVSKNTQEIAEAFDRCLTTNNSGTISKVIRSLAIRTAARLCLLNGQNTKSLLMSLASLLFGLTDGLEYEIYTSIAFLYKAKDKKIKLQVESFFKSESLNHKNFQTLEQKVSRDLVHPDRIIRCASIEILPILTEILYSDSNNYENKLQDLIKTLSKFMDDPSPQVKMVAIEEIINQHYNNNSPNESLYHSCVKLCKDENELVRLASLDLISIITGLYPTYPIIISHFGENEKIRLIDNSFVKVCDMVNDISIPVRQKAFEVLGKFEDVNSKFMMQTFSKKVMSHLKRPLKARNMGLNRNTELKNSHAGGDGGGKNLHTEINAPGSDQIVDVESDEFKLLNSGAAGAFVHGLEDEFQEVRMSAIDSIYILSKQSTEFAGKSVDFLIDLFNDSSDLVRLNAIQVLCAIGERITIELTSEQLSICISTIEDANSSIREHIYKFLSLSKLQSLDALNTLLNAMKKAIARYPSDKGDMFKTLKIVGENNCVFIDDNFAINLFGINKIFISKKANAEDPIYIANTILVINAFVIKKAQLSEITFSYVQNSLPYFINKYPGCFPRDINACIPKESNALSGPFLHLLFPGSKDTQLGRNLNTDAMEILKKCWDIIDDNASSLKDTNVPEFCESLTSQGAKTKGLSSYVRELSSIIPDLQDTDPELLFQAEYLELIYFIFVIRGFTLGSESIMEKKKLTDLIDRKINQLAFGFNGLVAFNMAKLVDFRILSQSVSLLSVFEYLDTESLRVVLDNFQKLLISINSNPEAVDLKECDTIIMLHELSDFPQNDISFAEKNKLKGIFSRFIKNFVPKKPIDTHLLKRIFAKFSSRLQNSAIEYNYEFPCSLNAGSTLYNISIPGHKISTKFKTLSNRDALNKDLTDLSHKASAKPPHSNSKLLQNIELGVLVKLPGSELMVIRLPESRMKIKKDMNGYYVVEIDAKVSVYLPISSGEVGFVEINIVRYINNPLFNDILPPEYGLQDLYKRGYLSSGTEVYSSSIQADQQNDNSPKDFVEEKFITLSESPMMIKVIPKSLQKIVY